MLFKFTHIIFVLYIIRKIRGKFEGTGRHRHFAHSIIVMFNNAVQSNLFGTAQHICDDFLLRYYVRHAFKHSSCHHNLPWKSRGFCTYFPQHFYEELLQKSVFMVLILITVNLLSIFVWLSDHKTITVGTTAGVACSHNSTNSNICLANSSYAIWVRTP